MKRLPAANCGQKPMIRYDGDLDPPGVRIPVAIQENLYKHHGLNSVDVQIHRIALNESQIEDYQLPHSVDAIKTKDPNYEWYAKRYGDIAVELDALHPEKLQQLQQLVKLGLGLYLDIEDMQQQQGIESRERERLKRFEQRVLDMAKEEGLLN